eukprot:TRINITY_DN5057_c0_g1_i4.p1 TRINITY_DN5057_c0_g1~~TRINITY_DN5057_c0_g1_i4.p1  ORF type:complete len:193 (-),score=53.75 TRINITY_DN5057_c0_g1_i4:259-837(-)
MVNYQTILVLSGKGGVGKSTVSSLLALSLVKMGKKVGLLDVDLCGPSIARIFGLEQHSVMNGPNGWIPVYADDEQRLGVMSLAFLTKRDDPVVWRGPKKTSIINQFVHNIAWGDIDFLIVDTPPGTSDEHITAVEAFKDFNLDGAILVTTPQNVSIDDVQKEASFCRALDLEILGVIENMSGYVCPTCSVSL